MTGRRLRTASTSSSSTAESSCDTTFGPAASGRGHTWGTGSVGHTAGTRTRRWGLGHPTHTPKPGEQTPSSNSCLAGAAHPNMRHHSGVASWWLSQESPWPQGLQTLHVATHPEPVLALTCPDDTDPWEQLLADGLQVAGLAGAGRAERAAVFWGENTEHPLRAGGTGEERLPGWIMDRVWGPAAA